MRSFLLLPALALAMPALADGPPVPPVAAAAQRPLSLPATAQNAAVLDAVQRALADGPAGTRYGILVTTMEGKDLLAIAPDQRFIPASNTKMFTTVTAFSELPVLDASAQGTGVRLEKAGRGAQDVVLMGHGDARLSGADDCTQDCLTTLADAVAARTRKVRNVIGDDTWFPDERWSPGMSWNNIQARYGTGISALTMDDNELTVTVAAGASGELAIIGAPGFYTIENAVRTVSGTESAIGVMRMPGSDRLVLSGTIGAEAKPETLRLGIDDPARWAAWRLKQMLEARGVRVTGEVQVRHRPLTPADDPAQRGGTPAAHAPEPEMLAQLPALPLAEDIRIINKVSQNLHAELMLRRVGRESGSGSIADGQAVLHKVMGEAGLPEEGYFFADGSGMSSYNRISPRAAVTLLGWAARQPWGMAWRETLPVGGVDGTLRSRFHDTPLDGKLFAKTGSLNASRALSGYLVTAKGQTLIFSTIANDVPDERDSEATAAMDKALLAIAAAY
ncbi:D-alanyl-D-alanine carboxypeptidase/D-alanyl-D-alanine endopeptidase [Novosphingobium naphthalenivorans]|uniref:D-alanyl-D-alanine carboxypeptidase/D-alanyl-D-alanine endopeptidase n=1 Tax=Novosphingobium naphthalenivorans TaxID=273168 RepID=UPI00082BF0B7|nr:D-alanyl-D-alanine carboxypeptidase/D-alanyl-D-alanine-endopeptidase [Novosphingobium naphthalenivorans]